MTLPGMWGVERFGRRRLLIIGAIGMCVCEFLVAIIGVTISVQNQAGQRVLIAFVCIYIVSLIPSKVYDLLRLSPSFRPSSLQHGDQSHGF